MKRKLIFIILVIGLSAIYYFAVSGEEDSFVHQAVSEMKKMVNYSTKISDSGESLAQESQSASMDQSDFAEVEVDKMSDEQLKQWISSESKSMDSTNNDTSSKAIELKEKAQTLNDSQLETLRDLALDTKLPANNRIFSAYLISLSNSTNSLDYIFDVAKKDVTVDGALLPHSEAELKHGQELAIRYMQIEALFHRAKTDSNALDKLKLLALEAETAQIRSYAEKKIKELGL